MARHIPSTSTAGKRPPAPAPGPLNLPGLPDYLRPRLPLVFVGFNPGETSARLGHYYAFKANLFWTALNESGLVPQPLTYLDDHRLPEFGIGITDLAKAPSRSSADLGRNAFIAGREALHRKLRRVRPRVVAFNGKGVYEMFTGRRCTLGLQPEELYGAKLFVLPSTSPRHAITGRAEKIAWFRRLKHLLDGME